MTKELEFEIDEEGSVRVDWTKPLGWGTQDQDTIAEYAPLANTIITEMGIEEGRIDVLNSGIEIRDTESPDPRVVLRD